MSSWSRTAYLAVLVMAVLLDAVILYFPVDAVQRLIIGLLLLPIILGAGVRFEITTMRSTESLWQQRGRVFREL